MGWLAGGIKGAGETLGMPRQARAHRSDSVGSSHRAFTSLTWRACAFAFRKGNVSIKLHFVGMNKGHLQAQAQKWRQKEVRGLPQPHSRQGAEE